MLFGRDRLRALTALANSFALFVLLPVPAAFAANVAADPDYVGAHEDVVSEICVPIVREGRVLGVVNVEESRVGALKEDDLAHALSRFFRFLQIGFEVLEQFRVD